MTRFAHILNIYSASDGSEASRIQLITLESIRRALELASDVADIEILSAQFSVDRAVVPGFVRITRDLERSVQDIVPCGDKRVLPLIHDILQRAYESTDAEFLVYSNMDIAVYPDFYRFLANAVSAGIDALAINRTQIPRHLGGRDVLNDFSLDEIFKIRQRSPHHGIDCVMFRRSTFPKWQPSRICIGYPPVGQYLLENAEAHAVKFVWFMDVMQTFHIGTTKDESSAWTKYQGNEISKHNNREFDGCRLHSESPWERHGVSRSRWILRRVWWMARNLLPWQLCREASKAVGR